MNKYIKKIEDIMLERCDTSCTATHTQVEHVELGNIMQKRIEELVEQAMQHGADSAVDYIEPEIGYFVANRGVGADKVLQEARKAYKEK